MYFSLSRFSFFHRIEKNLHTTKKMENRHMNLLKMAVSPIRLWNPISKWLIFQVNFILMNLEIYRQLQTMLKIRLFRGGIKFLELLKILEKPGKFRSIFYQLVKIVTLLGLRFSEFPKRKVAPENLELIWFESDLRWSIKRIILHNVAIESLLFSWIPIALTNSRFTLAPTLVWILVGKHLLFLLVNGQT